MIGGAKRHENIFAVFGFFKADRLNFIFMDTGDFKKDFGFFFFCVGIKHGYRSTDFSAYPKFGAIMGKLCMARALVDQSIGDNFLGFGINPMGHIGRFRGRNNRFPIG